MLKLLSQFNSYTESPGGAWLRYPYASMLALWSFFTSLVIYMWIPLSMVCVTSIVTGLPLILCLLTYPIWGGLWLFFVELIINEMIKAWHGLGEDLGC